MSCCQANQSCCPTGSWPALITDYEPKGKIIQLADSIQTYVVGSGTEDKAVLVLPDIFGIEGGRNKGICDQLQQAGFFVVMPEYFCGKAYDMAKFSTFGTDGPAWAKNFPYEAHRKSLLAALDFIESKGIRRIGTIGYCWGCWVSFYMGADPEISSRIRCAVDCHPSLKIESWIWQRSVDELAKRAQSGFPHLMLSGGNDPADVREGGSVIQILNEKAGSTSKVVDFENQQHGWVNRGDLSQPGVKEGVQKAMELATKFLLDHTQK